MSQPVCEFNLQWYAVLVLLEALPDFREVDLVACHDGSNSESPHWTTHTSFILHWHQNAMQVTAHAMVSRCPMRGGGDILM